MVIVDERCYEDSWNRHVAVVVYQELPVVQRPQPSGRLETTAFRQTTEVRRQEEIVEIVVVFQHRLDS
jgi:hypothetical protein